MPDAPGEYRFYCPVKSIEGKLTVREAPSVEPSARGLAQDEAQKTAQAEAQPEPQKPGHNEPKNAAYLRSLIED